MSSPQGQQRACDPASKADAGGFAGTLPQTTRLEMCRVDPLARSVTAQDAQHQQALRRQSNRRGASALPSKRTDPSIDRRPTVGKFLDGVKPGAAAADPDRVPGQGQGVAPIVIGLRKLTKDPRWPKAAARFNRRDHLNLDAHITALQQLRAVIGGSTT